MASFMVLVDVCTEVETEDMFVWLALNLIMLACSVCGVSLEHFLAMYTKNQL